MVQGSWVGEKVFYKNMQTEISKDMCIGESRAFRKGRREKYTDYAI